METRFGKRNAIWILSLLAAVLCNNGFAQGAPTATSVYKSEFAKAVDPKRWSLTETMKSPSGEVLLTPGWALRFTQEHLPEHQFLRVRIKLVIIGSHDGADAEEGPDHWTLSVKHGTVLVHTNFRNPGKDRRGLADGIGQSFPDQYPAGLHASQTGASGVGDYGFKKGDASYEIEALFPHSAKELELEFQEGLRNKGGDERWGIAGLELDAISGPVPRTVEQLKELWKTLQGKDPVAANKAARDLISSGRAAADFVEAALKSQADAAAKEAAARAKALPAQIEKLIADLSAKEFQTRVAARVEMKKLHLDALPILEKKLAAGPVPEVRAALTSIIKSLRARANSTRGEAVRGDLVAARAAQVWRILRIPESGRRYSASSSNSPLASLDDGWVPDVMKGNVVPRFDLWNSEDKHVWVQLEYPQARTFNSAEVFWFENRTWDKGARLPASWSLSFLDGDVWRPVKAKGKYPITYEKFDRVAFEPVTTRAIRLNAKGSAANRVALVEFRLGEKKPADKKPAVDAPDPAVDD